MMGEIIQFNLLFIILYIFMIQHIQTCYQILAIHIFHISVYSWIILYYLNLNFLLKLKIIK